MYMVTKLARVTLVGIALAVAGVGAAAAPLPYSDRPAIKVRNVLGVVMLDVATAGTRLVAVGEHGVIAYSDDRGKAWRQASVVPVDVTLTAVHFIDTKRGWAVGHAGVILMTADGGETWKKQLDGLRVARLAEREAEESGNPRLAREAARLVADGADKPFLAVHFSSPTQGMAVGAYNLIVTTNDGGVTWSSIMGRLDNLRGAHLYALGGDGQNVYIAGEQGVFFASSDGGRHFESRVLPYKGSWFSLAVQGDVLTVAGLRGNVYRSRDRGHTWNRMGEGPPVSFVSAAPTNAQGVLLANQAGQLFIGTNEGLKPVALPAVPPVNRAAPLDDGQVLLLTVQGMVCESVKEVLQ